MPYPGSGGKTFTAQLRIAAGGGLSSTLSGNVTVDGAFANFLQYDPGGSSRNVTFPVVNDWANAFFFVHNIASDAGELLALKDADAVTKISLDKGESALMFCDGTSWYAFPLSLVAEYGDGQYLTLGALPDDTIGHNGTNTIWSHITGDLIIDNVLVTGSTIMLLGTDTSAVDFQVQNNSGAALLTVTPTSASGGTTVASGLRAVSATAAAITTTRTLTAADSGGVFSVAKTSAYAITLPTPAQGMRFKFLILDTGANAVTFSDGAAHLFGQIQEAGTVPIAMTGTTLTAAASGSVGDWLEFVGIDATHYLVTGSSIAASKFTIA